MKKLILAGLMFIFSLTSPSPAVSEVYHLLRLKNGGELATPLYWVESNQLFFFYAGGLVGIEQQAVERVERREIERTAYIDATSGNAGKKPLPPSPAGAEKSPAPAKQPEAIKGVEEVNIEKHKENKDRLTVELDATMEKMFEAMKSKDQAAVEKAREEMRNISGQIYKLTDEATAKNKGKLPEGWWAK